MPVKFICVITSVSSPISLLSFYLALLSSGDSMVLKSWTINVWVLMYNSSFTSVNFTNVDVQK